MSQKIIQVAGYSNSGKTTLVEKIIAKLVNEKMRVGTIKHHGHSDRLLALDEGKDSWKHRQAGADYTTVVSNGELQLTMKSSVDWKLEQLLQIYRNFPIDIIIVEGFKKSPYPKIVLLRNENDVTLLSALENIFCVISWFPLQDGHNQNYSYFEISQDSQYLEHITSEVKGLKND